MALPNLTRDQAVERAALVTVDSYRIDLDLTDGDGKPGERTFRSTTTVSSMRSPAPTPSSTSPPTPVRSATLNGRDIDVSGYDESTGIALTGLAEHNVVVVDADCRYSNTGEGLHRFVDPVDGEVYLYSQFETADAKRMFACFDQPDLKATFDVIGDRAAALAGDLQRRHRGRRRRRTACTRFATTPRMSTYLVALIAGPYARWDDDYTDEHGEIPLGIFCRASLAEFMDAERLFTQTKQGFGFYHKQLRRALRVRQVRPAVRARVQRRRDGERRRGDVPGGLRLPQQGHPLSLRAARRDGAARDGAHVVRRPGHHAVVGRPVAQRVVRHLRLGAVPEPRPPNTPTRGRPSPTSRSPGPTGRTSCPRPIRWPPTSPTCTPSRSTSTASPTPRAPACSSSWSPTSGLEQFLAGLRDYFRAHAFGNATFGDLLGRAGEGLGPRPVRLGPAVAEDDRPEHAARRTSTSTPTARSPGSRSARAAPRPAPARRACTGSRSASTTTTAEPASLVRAHREELDVDGASTEVPALRRCFARQAGSGQRRRPDLLLAAAGPGVAADRAGPHRRHRRAAAPHAGVVGGLGDDPRRRAAGPRFRGAGARAAFRPRPKSGWRSGCCCRRRPRWAPTPTRTGPARRAGRRSPTGCWSWPAAPQPGSDHQLAFVNALCTSVLSTRHVAVLADLLDHEPAEVGTGRVWRSTPICAGASSPRWPPPAISTPTGPKRRSSTPRCSATRPLRVKRHGAQASAARPQSAVKEAAWTQVIEDDTLANITGRVDHRRHRRSPARASC